MNCWPARPTGNIIKVASSLWLMFQPPFADSKAVKREGEDSVESVLNVEHVTKQGYFCSRKVWKIIFFLYFSEIKHSLPHLIVFPIWQELKEDERVAQLANFDAVLWWLETVESTLYTLNGNMWGFGGVNTTKSKKKREEKKATSLWMSSRSHYSWSSMEDTMASHDCLVKTALLH